MLKLKLFIQVLEQLQNLILFLASASNAIVIGFNVRPDANAKRTAEAEKVDIRLHRVIYKAIEEIEAAMKGMLDPEYEEKVIGQVEVRKHLKFQKLVQLQALMLQTVKLQVIQWSSCHS